jgi:hypothetical protein
MLAQAANRSEKMVGNMMELNSPTARMVHMAAWRCRAWSLNQQRRCYRVKSERFVGLDFATPAPMKRRPWRRPSKTTRIFRRLVPPACNQSSKIDRKLPIETSPRHKQMPIAPNTRCL